MSDHPELDEAPLSLYRWKAPPCAVCRAVIGEHEKSEEVAPQVFIHADNSFTCKTEYEEALDLQRVGSYGSDAA